MIDNKQIKVKTFIHKNFAPRLLYTREEESQTFKRLKYHEWSSMITTVFPIKLL